MEKAFEEVNFDTIQILKAKGFKNIQFNLLLTEDSRKATVEIISGKEQNFELNLMSPNSREILYYFEGPSPMTKYVVDQDYL